ILSVGDDDDALSPGWVDRFLERNPNVQTKPFRKLDSARAYGSTREAYEEFYASLR
ncbi:hypothetical protein QBC46DRAFT_231049, partial [Diplogelasinospora grovesii]